VKNLRPIAFFLPQFHPIPENDAWWGKGFTEWTNVSKAKPLFPGHHQPHLPTDLGFYDLRLPEVRDQQARMAREYGIYGFCYYHYWFSGKRILERPFQEIIESGQPDLPFMLCWANENWTRIWDGDQNQVLLKQDYSPEDDRLHIRHLIPYFKDPRYIRVMGKPVFNVYRSSLVPDVKHTLAIWREEAAKEGLELYLCRVENFGHEGLKYMKDGFDAAIEFQPFTDTLADYKGEVLAKRLKNNIFQRAIIKWNRVTGNKSGETHLMNKWFSRIDYNEFVDFLMGSYKYAEGYTRFPGVTPSWDNTARRGASAFLFKEANPTKYKEWLAFHFRNFIPPSPEENFIFINAWNEWGEGNHLEPCSKWERQYLEATREIVLNKESSETP
jgi:lipopolysaccharide biosynthesis protein